MNRQFTLPVAVAVSFHAFLFLGFTKPNLATIPPKAAEGVPVDLAPPRPDEEPKEIAEADAGARRAEPSAPTLPEHAPQVVLIGISVTPTPPSVPRSLAGDLSKVPMGGYNTEGILGDGKNGPALLDSTYLDNPPKTRFQIAPQYPYRLKSAGVTGEVVVDFVVDEAGRVLNPKVVSSTHVEFEENTLRAVTQWKFEPGKRDGRAVRFRMKVPVVFSLREGD